MCFNEVTFFGIETESGFSRGLEILSACGSPFLVNAHLLVLVTVQNVSARQTPKVKKGIFLTTKTEHFTIKLVRVVISQTLSQFIGNLVLPLQPSMEVGGIQLIDIKFGKGNSLFEIEHRIVSTNGITITHIFDQLTNGTSPVRKDDFTLFQLFQIDRTLFCVIRSIKNRGNRKNLANKEILSCIGVTLVVHNLPSQIVNQRLCDCDILSLLTIVIDCVGQGCGFNIQNHYILSPLVVLSH